MHLQSSFETVNFHAYSSQRVLSSVLPRQFNSMWILTLYTGIPLTEVNLTQKHLPRRHKTKIFAVTLNRK